MLRIADMESFTLFGSWSAVAFESEHPRSPEDEPGVVLTVYLEGGQVLKLFLVAGDPFEAPPPPDLARVISSRSADD